MKTVPMLGAAALGLMLAWVANARYNQAPPAPPQNATPKSATQNAPLKSASSPGAPAKRVIAQSIQWRPSLEAAFAEAKKTGKPIMADFYADWCEPCQILDKAYEQPAMVAESRKWIPVKIDIDQNHFAMQTYNAGSLPTIVFFAPNGEEVGRKVGFAVPKGTKTMDALVKYLTQDVMKTMRANAAKSARKASL